MTKQSLCCVSCSAALQQRYLGVTSSPGAAAAFDAVERAGCLTKRPKLGSLWHMCGKLPQSPCLQRLDAKSRYLHAITKSWDAERCQRIPAKPCCCSTVHSPHEHGQHTCRTLPCPLALVKTARHPGVTCCASHVAPCAAAGVGCDCCWHWGHGCCALAWASCQQVTLLIPVCSLQRHSLHQRQSTE